jgi:HD-GYP domain-containing protein (c-di-GMP phosphodiesterase class II)
VYSLAIVKKLGMQSLRTLQDVGLGSLLHDVGMTMIPEEILNTAGALSPNDRALVEQHPLLGVDMLKGMADCSPVVLDIVTSHHEKLDGSGYPHRITQDNIAQSVRIVTVADIFDALHSYRPYRNALSVFDAFMTMTRDFRGKIDPQVLTNLIRAFHQ